MFTEIGLQGYDPILDGKMRLARTRLSVRSCSNISFVEPTAYSAGLEAEETRMTAPKHSPNLTQALLRSQIPFPQLLVLAALLSIAFPAFMGLHGGSKMTPVLAEAGFVLQDHYPAHQTANKRQTTDTDICKRWSGQSALVNGTVYYYGGRATTSADQTTDQWSKSNLYASRSDESLGSFRICLKITVLLMWLG